MSYKQLVFPDRESWLEWRHTGIGSSDASIIMGVSKFKTRNELLLEKALPFKGDKEQTYIQKRGDWIEKIVRDLFNKNKSEDTKYASVNCESDEFPFMRASLDGLQGDNKRFMEVKLLSSITRYKLESGDKTPGLELWELVDDGKIPEQYYPQVQHQMMVTGLDLCNFAGYREIKGETPDINNVNDCFVERNDEYIKQLAIEEFKFWYEVQELKRNRKGLE